MRVFANIDRMEGALTFHRDRHSVIAGNVANVDTPGYRPVDLERPTDMFDVGLGERGYTTAFDDSSMAVSADGNAVNLERELAKIDANRVRYSTSAELVTRRMAILRYAATDGAGG